MRKSFSIISVFLAIMIISNIAKGEGKRVSLSVTLRNLDHTYNPHKNVKRSAGKGIWKIYSSGENKLEKVESTTFSYSGCHITIHRKTTNYLPTSKVSVPSGHDNKVETFSLRNIDPASIRFLRFDSHGESGIGTLAKVIFKTYRQKPMIKWTDTNSFTDSDYVLSSHGNEYQSSFLISTAHYAPKFTKAFSHAIRLCESKPSPL